MSILKNLVGISAASIDEILANPSPLGIVVFDNEEGKYLKLDSHFAVEKEFTLVKLKKENSVREVRCFGDDVYYLASKGRYSRIECLFSPKESIDFKDQITGFSMDNSKSPVVAGKKGLYDFGSMLFLAEDARDYNIDQIIRPVCWEGRTFALVEYMSQQMGIIEVRKGEAPIDVLLYDFHFTPGIVSAEIINFGNTAALDDGTFYPFSFLSCVSRNSLLINDSEIKGSEEPSRISHLRAGFIKGKIAEIFFESNGKICALKTDLINNTVVSKQVVYESKSGVFDPKFDLVTRGELEKRIIAFSSAQK